MWTTRKGGRSNLGIASRWDWIFSKAFSMALRKASRPPKQNDEPLVNCRRKLVKTGENLWIWVMNRFVFLARRKLEDCFAICFKSVWLKRNSNKTKTVASMPINPSCFFEKEDKFVTECLHQITRHSPLGFPRCSSQSRRKSHLGPRSSKPVTFSFFSKVFAFVCFTLLSHSSSS